MILILVALLVGYAVCHYQGTPELLPSWYYQLAIGGVYLLYGYHRYNGQVITGDEEIAGGLSDVLIKKP